MLPTSSQAALIESTETAPAGAEVLQFHLQAFCEETEAEFLSETPSDAPSKDDKDVAQGATREPPTIETFLCWVQSCLKAQGRLQMSFLQGHQ